MWERIGESSAVVIGAVVLFLLFAIALFIMEKDELLKTRRSKNTLCIVPKHPDNIRSFRKRHAHSPQGVRRYDDIKMRKIS